MDCPQCHASNPATAARCLQCDTPIPASAATPGDSADPSVTLDQSFAKDWSAAAAPQDAGRGTDSKGNLNPGFVLAGRYEIRERLGTGGMGSVYRAKDRELDRSVAIKVVRPELAEQSDILRRFKQELILARQVTHKNVIRIFDLGEDAGIKFITMEYIEGQNLKSMMDERGKLSYDESAGIIQQVCLALEAAHAEGVVHRDLKPHNIMVDKRGRILVMDFGIARSAGVAGMTMTGALVGTPDYMSPEQVRGDHVDARSDLFSLGIIYYELLTGKKPYSEGSAESAMFRRTIERAKPPQEMDPQVPRYLSEVVAKCLETDVRHRYQTAREIWDDLERWKQGASASRWATLQRTVGRNVKTRGVGIAAGVLLLVIVGGLVLRQKFEARTPARGAAVTAAIPLQSLAIFPFRNATSDSKLDWLGSSVAQMLTDDIGQSGDLRTVSADRASQILQDLHIAPDARLDSHMVERLAEYSNAEVIVWGQIAKLGDRLRLEATLQDIKNGHSSSFHQDAENEKNLFAAVDSLAKDVRSSLSLSSKAIHDLETQAGKPSSTSLLALQSFQQGLLAARGGNNLEAAKQFVASTKEDPNFALAFSKLGESYAALGQDTDAEVAAMKAVDLSQTLGLPPQEKFLISASRSKVMKDYPKAITGYEELAKVRPGDTDILFDLGGLYENSGNFDKAREAYGKVRGLDPKRVDALLAQGRVEIKSGDSAKGLDYLSSALNLATQFNRDEQQADIRQAMGVAYQLLNRLPDALRSFQDSLEIKRKLGLKSGIAESLSAIAQVNRALGKPDLALQGYTEALNLTRETGDKAGTAGAINDLGNLLYDQGNYEKALNLFKEFLRIETELGSEQDQGLALNNIGNIYLAKGDYEDAHTYFEQALQKREKFQVDGDTADTLHNLGETSTNLGLYGQALAQYLRAVELRRKIGDKRGGAIESYSMGTVFGLQGRYGAALDAHRDALKTFQELGEQGFWLAQIQSGYGEVYAQMGKSEEAQTQLDAAQSIALGLKNQGLVARIKGFQGDRYFCRGEFKAARPLYKDAQHEASRTTDRELALLSSFNLAKVDVEEQGLHAPVTHLESLRESANAAGMKYLSLQCSLYISKALIQTKRYAQAQSELQRALVAGEKMGTDQLVAQCHYLLGQVSSLTGNQVEFQRQQNEAVRILTSVQQEAHTDLRGRYDLAKILAVNH
jgi:tetratricopeptide (TPR) repeat protein/predicted Ser/Thr protein kinase